MGNLIMIMRETQYLYQMRAAKAGALAVVDTCLHFGNRCPQIVEHSLMGFTTALSACPSL